MKMRSSSIFVLAAVMGCVGLRAADYHFAEGGSDANDGLSPERPLQTIGRLNALDLKPGDRVLFRRGDLFRGAIKAKNGVTYAAYGEGDELPTICASKRDYADPKLWDRTDEPNVWRCTEKLHNVGIVLFDREPRRIDGAPVVADMRLPKREEPFDKPVVLDADLTFRNLFREDRLELRSDKGNPGERFRHIEIGEHGHCLWINADDLLIENLHLTLSGSHGVGGSGERRNVTVRNCRIDWLGGSIIEGWRFGTVRFGNAIEIWGGCDGFYALGNRIANIYDTGVTIQCNDREDFVCRMENVLFASNVIDNCFWGLEYYNKNNAPGSFTRNVRFVGNLCRGTGRGWGCKGREARAPAISIGETPEGSSGNVVEENSFLGSTGPLVTLRELVAKESWSFRGNVYAQRPGGILVSREPRRTTFATSSEKVRAQTFPLDAHAAETVRRELGDPAARIVRRLRVLAIGNSFSQSMMRSFPKAAAAYPDCELDIVNMMIGGCTLERHWSNVEKSSDPAFRPYDISSSYAFDGDVAARLPKKANIPEMLKADKWDVVTIQQGSSHSPFPEKYEPFAGNLIAKIRELAPQAQVWIQQTWSYSPYSDRLSDWKMTQESMHRAVHDAYAAIASKHGLRTIPTGDAVALYREKLPVDYKKVYTKAERAALAPETKIDFYGDVTGTATWKKNGRLGIDAHHLNGEGKYLQACVWLAALFDVDVTKLAYEPQIVGFSDKARLMRECAAAAVRTSRKD